MAHAQTAPENMSRVSVDPAEMESFSRMAENWWDPKGPFKPLHIMNGARLGFIKETLCEHFHRDPDIDQPLKGLRILDICLLYTSPSPRDATLSRMPSSA